MTTDHTHAIPIEHNLPKGPLWPYKHSREELNQIKNSNPYVFSAQYDQSPSPLGGGIFKDEWWRYYDTEPYLYYKIITADTAQKTKEHNDFSVFQCWGKGDRGIYLLDQVKGKWESPELITTAENFYLKSNMGVNVVGMYVEDKVSGTGLIQTLRKGTATRKPIAVVPVQRNIDKVTRAHGCVPQLASGFVFIPNGRDWVSDYVTEHSKFTALMNHKHDDQVDATMDAIEVLLIKGGVPGQLEEDFTIIEGSNYEGDICS